jgi:hypothetical protein
VERGEDAILIWRVGDRHVVDICSMTQKKGNDISVGCWLSTRLTEGSPVVKRLINEVKSARKHMRKTHSIFLKGIGSMLQEE